MEVLVIVLVVLGSSLLIAAVLSERGMMLVLDDDGTPAFDASKRSPWRRPSAILTIVGTVVMAAAALIPLFFG